MSHDRHRLPLDDLIAAVLAGLQAEADRLGGAGLARARRFPSSHLPTKGTIRPGTTTRGLRRVTGLSSVIDPEAMGPTQRSAADGAGGTVASPRRGVPRPGPETDAGGGSARIVARRFRIGAADGVADPGSVGAVTKVQNTLSPAPWT